PVVVGFEAHLAETGRLLRSGGLWASPRFYLPRLLVNNGLIARCAWRRAKQYVVSSQHQAAELRRLGFPETRISVLPNVVDTGKLERLDRREARRRLGLPDDVQLIAYVGHYHHVKGVEVLVEAFADLARRRDSCSLVLAWSGLGDPRPIERAIQGAGVADRVIRAGRIPIGAFLSAVDVLALPYRSTMGQHAYPGLILEAMAIGVPLVTSDLPLLRDLLTHERTGLLVPPGDTQALAQGVDQLLEDRALAGQMAAAQRQLLAGRLNPKEVAKRYVRVYRQALAGQATVLRPTEG
ncbi:MAG: glycosyltransferase, partial [Chloroflexi bacterium]|nr:glycosyltransferase [Chloroflexota bacterium]